MLEARPALVKAPLSAFFFNLPLMPRAFRRTHTHIYIYTCTLYKHTGWFNVLAARRIKRLLIKLVLD